MKQWQTIIEEFFKRQDKLRAIEKLQQENCGDLIQQPILRRHLICSDECLEFKKRKAQLLTIEFKQEIIEMSNLQDCPTNIASMLSKKQITKKKIIIYIQTSENNYQKKEQKTFKQYIKETNQYKELGYSNQIICGLYASLGQVQQNARLIQKNNIK